MANGTHDWVYLSQEPGAIRKRGSALVPCDQCGSKSTRVVLRRQKIMLGRQGREAVYTDGLIWCPACTKCAEDMSLVEKMGEMTGG